MSAWAEIVCADCSPEWLAMCNRALAEIQTEQRRKDAAKIRKLREYAGHVTVPPEAVREILEWAAVEIDPEMSTDV